MAQSKEFEAPFLFNNSSTAPGFTGLHHQYLVENFHSLPFDRVSGALCQTPESENPLDAQLTQTGSGGEGVST